MNSKKPEGLPAFTLDEMRDIVDRMGAKLEECKVEGRETVDMNEIFNKTDKERQLMRITRERNGS